MDSPLAGWMMGEQGTALAGLISWNILTSPLSRPSCLCGPPLQASQAPPGVQALLDYPRLSPHYRPSLFSSLSYLNLQVPPPPGSFQASPAPKFAGSLLRLPKIWIPAPPPWPLCWRLEAWIPKQGQSGGPGTKEVLNTVLLITARYAASRDRNENSNNLGPRHKLYQPKNWACMTHVYVQSY